MYACQTCKICQTHVRQLRHMQDSSDTNQTNQTSQTSKIIKNVHLLQFKVHSTILSLVLPSKYWNSELSFWSNQSEKFVSMTLHFLYGQCFPENATVKQVEECLRVVGHLPEFERLAEACRTFLRNKPLMNRELNFTYLNLSYLNLIYLILT